MVGERRGEGGKEISVLEAESHQCEKNGARLVEWGEGGSRWEKK